jgi:hypothetical protein
MDRVHLITPQVEIRLQRLAAAAGVGRPAAQEILSW